MNTTLRRTIIASSILAGVATSAHAAAAPTIDDAAAPDDASLVPHVPGGLTADIAGRLAATTSYAVRASEQSVAGAAARVDAAWAAYLPRLSGAARYTRHSDFTPPSLAFGGGPPVSFPVVLDQWSFQASVVVPISDYVFRVRHGHASAEAIADAARFDLAGAKARAATEGKLAYYGWLTARAGLTVARTTLELQRTFLTDAKSQLAAGNASNADVLQAESAVAAAELAVTRAASLVEVSERQLRITMHAAPGERLEAGESLADDAPPVEGSLADLVRLAERSRPELESTNAAIAGTSRQSRVARAGMAPALSAFGDAVYANPNARRFPQRDEWFGTWAVGVQLTWSPNDLLLGGSGGREADARAAELAARRAALRDAVELEVTQAYESAREADAAVFTTRRQLDSAREAFRIARALFANGRATATQVREADAGLTRSRLDALHARAQVRTSRVRLEHAVGRVAVR